MKKKNCNWQWHSHSIVTFLYKRRKKKEKKKSKLINGKLGFFLALHDSPFSQLFILLLSLQKLDGLPEAGLRFMRISSWRKILSKIIQTESVWKGIVWLSPKSLWLVHIFYVLERRPPNTVLYFESKKCKT